MGKHLLTAFVVLGSAQLLSGQSANAPFLSELQRIDINRTVGSDLDPGDQIIFGPGNEGCPEGKKIISFACRFPSHLDGIQFYGGSFNNDELTQIGCAAGSCGRSQLEN